jgi:tripartite-type tricarboxylate transporter receptor subunit TctC
MSGQVQVYFASAGLAAESIRTGNIRALAVTTATRLEIFPSIPTIAEYLAGYEASSWFGIGAPANTPAEIIDRLSREINAGLADPKLKARLAEFGTVLPASSPSDFGKFLVEETDKWAKVIRDANIKAQ